MHFKSYGSIMYTSNCRYQSTLVVHTIMQMTSDGHQTSVEELRLQSVLIRHACLRLSS